MLIYVIFHVPFIYNTFAINKIHLPKFLTRKTPRAHENPEKLSKPRFK